MAIAVSTNPLACALPHPYLSLDGILFSFGLEAGTCARFYGLRLIFACESEKSARFRDPLSKFGI